MEEARTKATAVSGPDSVAAANLAAEDCGGTILGRSIQMIVGDHPGKSDLASISATRRFDQDGVSPIVRGGG
jgi:branched-chain amino acid transport system substrate-binding protein